MNLAGNLIEKGQKWAGSLKVTEDYSIPMYSLCGKEEGKTLVVTAGVHGCEYVGVETARRLWKSLNPEEMKGQVIILPLINANGFYQGKKQIMPEDGENLNRMFPGKAEGSLSQKVACAIEKEIYPHADFLVDLHGGDCNEEMEPLVFFPVAALEEVNESSRLAASCLPVNYRVRSTAKNGLYSYATQRGIPALLLEIGGEGKWNEAQVAQCEESVHQLMRYLNILEAKEGTEAVTAGNTRCNPEQKEIVKAIYEEADTNGFWYPEIKSGQKVAEGDLLGRIYDLEGNILAEYKAQLEGVILYYTTALGIVKGDPLIAYGTD